MEKGLTVPKWVLKVWPKIPPIPQNLSIKFVCPGAKVLDFYEKRLHWASIVRDSKYTKYVLQQSFCLPLSPLECAWPA